MHPKTVGDRSTLAIMLALHRAGYVLYVPFGENTRSDLVIERDGLLHRVQCKTGRLRGGAVRFNTTSTYAHHKRPWAPRPYTGEVDAFGVYCPETESVYLVPIADAPLRRQAALRVEPPKNGQTHRCRQAVQYIVGRA